MTALAAARSRSTEKWARHDFTLLATFAAFKGGSVALDPATGKVQPATTNASHLVIGTFAETLAANVADQTVSVDLGAEITVEWRDNSGTNAIAATDVGKIAYFEDDQTVGILASAGPVAGRIWAYSAADGVAVEKLQSPAASNPVGVATAYAANDSIIPANPPSGAVYDVPTTGAASTVTLPATAVEGTVLTFVADGTKNGHTVQYRDATGPTNITTALTASKRHTVIAVHLNNIWTANAYVSP